MRNASGQKGEMSDNVKKANRNAYGISNTKPVSGKFLEPVSCCSRAKQCNGKEMYKKVCCTCKIDILQIRSIAVFFCRSRCLRRLTLHDFMLCLSKL